MNKMTYERAKMDVRVLDERDVIATSSEPAGPVTPTPIPPSVFDFYEGQGF